MKHKITYSLLLAAASCGVSLGQTTAYTTPVGYVSLGDTTPGQPAVKATTDVAVSIPLHRSVAFAGAVGAAGTTSSTISVDGTPWTANQWNPGAADPYLVAIKSGSQNGFIGLITGTTSNVITVTPITGGALATVLPGATFQIYQAWTLSKLFPVGTIPTGGRILAFTGTSSGINLPPDLNYIATPAGFINAAGGASANNAILYSGESFVIRSTAAGIPTLTVAGEVPVANSRAYIDKLTVGVAQDTRLSYVSPVDEIIGNSGLNASLGLVPGDRLLAFDNGISGLNKPPSVQLTWTGSAWLQGATNVTASYLLKSGQGYVIRRAATAPVGSLDWVDQQTYIPSL